MADAQTILAPLQLPDAVKADAWDAVHGAANADDLTARLKKLPLNDSVRADLWDAGNARFGAAKPQDWSDKLGLTNSAARAVVDLAEGAAAGVNSTIFHGGDIVRRMTGQDRIINDPAVQEHMRAPANLAGGAGKFLEQAAEFAAPGGIAREVTAGASLAARALAQAGVGAAVSTVQTGGDPAATAAGGALGGGSELVGPLARGAKALILGEKAPTLANWAESFGNATPTQKARITRSLDVLSDQVPPDSVHETQDLIKSKLDEINQAYSALDPAIKARTQPVGYVVQQLQDAQNQFTRRGVVTDKAGYDAIAKQIKTVQDIAATNGGSVQLDDLIHMKTLANGKTNWQSSDADKSLWRSIGDAYRGAADALAPETTPINRAYSKFKDLEQIIDQNIERGKGTTPSGLSALMTKGVESAAGAKTGAAIGGALAGPVGAGAGTIAGAIAGPRLGKAAAQALQNAVDSGAFRALSPARQGLITAMARMGDNAGLLKVLGVAATEESATGQ